MYATDGRTDKSKAYCPLPFYAPFPTGGGIKIGTIYDERRKHSRCFVSRAPSSYLSNSVMTVLRRKRSLRQSVCNVVVAGAFRVEMKRCHPKDRTVLCCYNPTECGLYTIHIRWSGVDIPSSPFHVRICRTMSELECYERNDRENHH